MIKNYLSILAENGEKILAEIAVAPFVGAWIETDEAALHEENIWSLPLWERGLKHVASLLILARLQSLPLWERGLKRRS